MSESGWWAALREFMAENDRAHRALPGGWRARVDALYLQWSERLEAGRAPERRQQWQDYERKSSAPPASPILPP